MRSNYKFFTEHNGETDEEKNQNGSPHAEVKFNTQIRKGDHFKWR